MKAPLLLMAGLLLFVATGQAAPTPTDSLKVQMRLMAKRQDSLMTGLKQLSKSNDSLNKELRYYRAKDDFYVMAVDRQGSHFEWLLGSTLAIVAFFTYAYFIDEFKRVRREFDALLNKYLNKADDISYKMYRQSAFALASSTHTIDALTVFMTKFSSPNMSSVARPQAILTVALRFTALVDDVRAYLLVDDNKKEADDCLTDISNHIIYMDDKLTSLLENEKLKIDEDTIRSTFDWRDVEALVFLNNNLNRINNSEIRREVLKFLLRIEPFIQPVE